MPQLAIMDGKEATCVDKVAALNSCDPPDEVVAAVDHTVIVAARVALPLSSR